MPPSPPQVQKEKHNKDFWFREKTTSFTLGFFSIKIESCKSIRRKLPSGPLSRHLHSNQNLNVCVKSTSHSHSLPTESLGRSNWFRSIHSELTIIARIFGCWASPPRTTSHSLVQWARWIYSMRRTMLGDEQQSCCPPHSRITKMNKLWY